jgi:hypothetical protein
MVNGRLIGSVRLYGTLDARVARRRFCAVNRAPEKWRLDRQHPAGFSTDPSIGFFSSNRLSIAEQDAVVRHEGEVRRVMRVQTLLFDN